jgi:hypothetical protein
MIAELCPNGVEYKELYKVVESASNISWQNNSEQIFQLPDAHQKGAIIMSVELQKAQYCVGIVATAIVSQYAKEHGLSPTDALRIIMRTKTYDLLQDPESRLCFESAESILDMILAEERGDWDEWAKV